MDMSHNDQFSRNRGFFTSTDLEKIRASTVAIAGVGGVGGFPAERLTRMGVGGLKLADPEEYAITDLNRQFGSSHSVIGEKKVRILSKILKDINPALNLETFEGGIDETTISSFLSGVDCIIDAIELFRYAPRRTLYAAARERRIPIFLSGAVGFAAPLLVFYPDGMPMEEYFNVPNDPRLQESFVLPLERLCPAFPDYIDASLVRSVLARECPVPAVSPTCALAGSILAFETIMFLMGKRRVPGVPQFKVIDLLRDATITGGNNDVDTTARFDSNSLPSWS
jgi:molybdopterin/thiamine biosynthesis adenylyltransferase